MINSINNIKTSTEEFLNANIKNTEDTIKILRKILK